MTHVYEYRYGGNAYATGKLVVARGRIPPLEEFAYCLCLNAQIGTAQ